MIKTLISILIFLAILILIMLLTTDTKKNLQIVRTLSQSTWPNNKVMQNIMYAQAILESNLEATPSKLALQYNNLFGMKPGITINKKGTNGLIIMQTTECSHNKCYKINQTFLNNKAIEDSSEQYKQLMSIPHYHKVINSSSFEEAANALVSSGYATDPNYAKNLIQIYHSYIKPLSNSAS